MMRAFCDRCGKEGKLKKDTWSPSPKDFGLMCVDWTEKGSFEDMFVCEKCYKEYVQILKLWFTK